MRPCCTQAKVSAVRWTQRSQRYVQPLPDPITHDYAVARGRVEGRGQLAPHGEESAKDMTDRLAEALGRVLHARIQAPEAAIPGSRASHAMVIEASHDERSDYDATRQRDEQDGRRIGGLPAGERHQQPPGCIRASGATLSLNCATTVRRTSMT